MEEQAIEEAVTDMAVTSAGVSAETLDSVQSALNSTIYLMGFSFILGVVFTVFILLVLDFMRRNKQETE
jgi:heme/copper-type cytochrome/quinol oxidase subunit 2